MTDITIDYIDKVIKGEDVKPRFSVKEFFKGLFFTTIKENMIFIIVLIIGNIMLYKVYKKLFKTNKNNENVR